MADIEINVSVVGADNAAKDIKDFGDSVQTAGDNAKTAGSSFQSVGSRLSDFKSNLAGVVGSFTALGTSILDIVRNFTSLEQASIRTDTANKRVQQSAIQVEAAQKKYNDAVKKYGENSKEAETAQEKLSVATKNHEIALDRAQLQQQQYNERLAELATNIIPSVIGVFGSITGIIGNFTQKGEAGVSLIGKLKQSFTDLIGGGSGVQSALGSAGNAMTGLGSRAGSAGAAASGFKNEVLQLGTGITQTIPGLSQLGGGLTNTAATAERSVGPLGSIESAVTAVAPAAAGAAGPLASFGGAVGEAGAVSVEAAGSLEAAAVSTGALEASSVTAAAESTALAASIGGVSVGLAAETAGISLAVAALVLYIFNIGGAKDKTDAAATSAQKFLAIGWEGFAKKFDPVNKAINNALDSLGKLLNLQKTASGQFGPQPEPGKAPAPGGTQGTLDEIIKLENQSKARQPLLNVSDILTFGTGLPLSSTIKDINDYQGAIMAAGVATKASATGVRFAGENFKQMEADSKGATGGLQSVTQATTTQAQAMIQSRGATLQAQEALVKMAPVAIEVANALQSQKITQAFEDVEKATKGASEGANKYQQVFDQLNQSVIDNTNVINANAQILGSTSGQQKLYNQGLQEMILKLQNADAELIKSRGSLDALNANLDHAQLTAYNQGWIDFQTTLDQVNITASHTQGVFDAFVASIGTQKGQITEFNAGFTTGEADVQKWAEGLLQGQAKVEGVSSALSRVLPLIGVQFPAGLNLSNKAMMDWAEAVTSGSQAVTAALESADKQWSSILDNFNKAALAAPGEQQKAWSEFQKVQRDAFGELQKALQSHTGNQQQAWNEYYKKIGEAQQKFTTDSQASWSKYFQQLNETLARPLTAGEQTLIQSMARMDLTLKKGIATLNQDIEGMKLGLPESAFNAQRDFNTLITQLTGDLATLPQSAQRNYGALIDMVNKLPVRTQDDWNKKLAALQVVLNAVEGPAQSFADVSNNVKGALQGIVKVNPDGTITRYGNSATAAKDPADKLKSASDSLKTVLNDLSTKTYTVGIDTSVAVLAIQYLQFLLGKAANPDTPYTVSLSFDDAAVLQSLQFVQDQINTMITGGGQGYVIEISADTGFAANAIQTLVDRWIIPLEGTTIIPIAADTGPAASALQALVDHWITPLEGTTIIPVSADTGPAASAIQALVDQWVIPLESGDTIIHVTADTGAATSALSTLANQWVVPLESGDTIIHVTADTGPATSAISTLVNQWVTPLETGQTIIQVTANTGPAASAIQQLQNMVNQMIQRQYILQITANTGPAASAIQQVQQTVNQLINRQYVITVTANTGPAASAINALQQQLNALKAQGSATGVPLTFARTGGEFTLGPGGFEKTAEGSQLHAAKGGAFIVTKETRLANLTVGEGNRPELLQFTSGKGGHGIGMLSVTPIKVPRFHAAAGGQFPIFGSAPGPGLFPGTSFGNFQPSGGAPISYGSGIPAPVQTVGQGGPQQGMPSEVGAGTIIVQGQNGVPVTKLGQYGAPSYSGGGIGGLIPGQPATNTSNVSQGVSAYQMNALATNVQENTDTSSQTQSDISDLVSMVKKLLSSLTRTNMNTNLVVDGQKMASTVSKYIGSGAYGGR